MSTNDAWELGFVAWATPIDQEVYHLGLNVPAGRRAYIAYRELILTENSYRVDLIVAENGFTGGELGYGSVLREGGSESVGSRVYGGVTPSGAVTILGQDTVEAGGAQGNATLAANKTPDEILRSYTSSPMLRITRAAGGTGAYRLSLRTIVYEEQEG